MATYVSRLVSRCVRRGFLHSVLLALSVLAVLSLLLLLHAVHLLHDNRVVPHRHPASSPGLEDWLFERWRVKADDDDDHDDDDERSVTGQKCVHPRLRPDDPSIMQFYSKEPPVDCSQAMEDWIFVDNGTFRISRRARRLYGKITCEYAPIVRGDDFSARHAPHVKPMLDGAPLQSDFFKVACVSASGKRYMNIHSGVAWNSDVLERLQKHAAAATKTAQQLSFQEEEVELPPLKQADPRSTTKTATTTRTHTDTASEKQAPAGNQPNDGGLNLNVFMFGFDSLSRMAWLRLLPKTRAYFLNTLGGRELEGYNILGDGTPAALLPILTGKMEEELPEARRGFTGATTVDNHPWIWKEFSKHGFVTAHAEDMAMVGTFQLRMLGFKDQPTDHNMRTFYLAAERMYKHNAPLCLGSKPRHVNFMNWFRELFAMYREFPKFFFGFHSELSHDLNNKVQALDQDMVEFLQDLEKNNHLNSTLLILMADHGARYNYIRATAQGKLEERMPYFSFRFPPWFQKQHPEILRNLEINSKRLTTPFDVHETFLEVLNYTGGGTADIRRQRGVSLFKEIPKERTCSHAGITPHWCACLEWQRVNRSDSLVMRAVQSAIRTINRYTSSMRKKCVELTLLEITRGARYRPNSDDISAENKMTNYKHSNRPDNTGGVAPPPSNSVELYQVSFRTEPGGGHFEVTCTHDLTSGAFSVNAKDISRINKYGSQPKCIQESLPHLRPYCYCNSM